MKDIDGRTILSPSDLVGFLACEHLTQLELCASRGEFERAERVDAELDLLSRLGEAHEVAHRDRLRAERGMVVEIADPAETLDGLRAAEIETLAAMRGGVPVIYQAAFFDGRWRGRADFLLRVDTPSGLGGWSYEVADTKLARSVKVAALLQMCEYSRQVARLQERAPESMHVILGDGSEETHRVADYDAYCNAARNRLEMTVAGPALDTYPEPVAHCAVCRWIDRCSGERRADDHLSLVAGMRRDHTRRLCSSGITTVAALAGAPEEPVADIGDAPWARLHQQARLQVHERTTGHQVYELLQTAAPDLGLAALPEPSDGDLFFDMEGDPFAVDGGLEYLFGITELVAGAPQHHAFWAHSRAEEKLAFEALVDLVIDRLARDPDLHVYHYAAYEETALKKLMGRHGTREDEVDRLLRGGVLVDLYRIVTQGVRVSKEKYSLKSLEAYYMPGRDDAITDAAGSIVAYQRWIDTRDSATLDEIAAYNRRDCESTWRLREWLENRRDELATLLGHDVPRPEPRESQPSEGLALASAETAELVEQLTAGVTDDAAARDADQQARWLLAQLLDWHRREDKSAWWAYYDRCEKTDEELVEDAEAIGAITHLGEVRIEKKSTVHRYAFDATQEYKLGAGDTVHDPRTQSPCGKIVDIDGDAGILDLTRGPSLADRAHPRSLIPATPWSTAPMRQALRRIAGYVIAHGIHGPGRYHAARDLLLKRSPTLCAGLSSPSLVGDGEDPVTATCRLVNDLDDSFLAVQGPPGCGKTYSGAHVIVDLVRRGRRVGVSATTHRAIGNLLEKMCKVAAEQRQPVRVLQRCDDDEQACSAPGIRRARNPDEVENALRTGEVDVVAGTSWLFSDARFDGILDVIVIDEAGQMSLANACAVATATHNLVLLGDPQQLAQPSQGIHPEGAERSALEHVLEGLDTIPADRGVFLPTTWRMHPDVCRFVSQTFYEGRLHAHASCSRQRIDGAGELDGTGARRVAIEHAGNRTWSPEEVAAVHEVVDRLLSARWTDGDGEEHPLGLDDILIVAPYNAQVKRIRDRLPDGARVGTVDKFQGQEAPVTIYAMATSSAEDVPRNLEFLFSRNRLNVAVSRARALSIVICSSELIGARCHTPGQLRLVNALCRYAELASPVVVATGQLVG
ncbi:MAG TPA: TM0106 family RecB-like putative nuclease [Candidatus Dormibacteraeota bacterium]|nr:TM0106 family RecB-like putative nuclease [Candidatus Dormibacteraeota bacterium]